MDSHLKRAIFDYNERIKTVTTSASDTKNETSYSGVVEVFSFSPIYQLPTEKSLILMQVKDQLVTIIKHAENGFYQVQCGNVKGFLNESMIKGQK